MESERRPRRKFWRRRIRRYSRRCLRRPEESSPYTKRDALLSPGELAFYGVLRRAVSGQLAISIKTRLADIVHCPEEHWESVHGRRLSQKHLDFVLYDRYTSQIVAAVELDDRSHDRPERRRRDEFVDATLADVGVILIRIRAARRYDLSELAAQLTQAICQRN